MTRIAVFCDGTWNSPNCAEPTHVHKLMQAVRRDRVGDQVAAYFSGIGTDTRFDGPVTRVLRKYGGGAFGWGLDEKVKQAYQFVAEAYRPGDRLYFFGFSRGAYTARSVVGMIRKCGIVQDTSPAGINRAYALYRLRGSRNAPDQAHILEARRALSPRYATSETDLAWRGDRSVLVDIAYLGVWDTVGARGIPAALGPVAHVWNRRYRFHDTELSSLMKSARHAVALDETRMFYPPALWSNLDTLHRVPGERAYRQLWFVGTHSIVGGSGAAQGLAAFPLLWVFEGARDLKLDPAVRFPPTPPDALEEAAEIRPRRWLLRRWRKGPQRWSEGHASLLERLDGRGDYRPAPLKRLPARDRR